jgi:hypothetical protein
MLERFGNILFRRQRSTGCIVHPGNREANFSGDVKFTEKNMIFPVITVLQYYDWYFESSNVNDLYNSITTNSFGCE